MGENFIFQLFESWYITEKSIPFSLKLLGKDVKHNLNNNTLFGRINWGKDYWKML